MITQKTQKYQILTEEDEISLGDQFNSQRGPFTNLLRAILQNSDQPRVEIEIHRYLLASSYFHNPATICQQLKNKEGVPYDHLYSNRRGDLIVITASLDPTKPDRSFQQTLLQRLQDLPKENDKGQPSYLDIPNDDIPRSYRYFPNQIATKIRQRSNNTINIKVKAYQKFMRFWLIKS